MNEPDYMSSENYEKLKHLIDSGLTEARRGNFFVAMNLLKQISESQLHNESDYLRVGKLASMIGQHEYAIHLIQCATKLHPDMYNAWAELGNAYCNYGDIKGAIDAYEKTLSINSNVVLPGLAQAYDIIGNYDRADTELARIAEHRFKFADANKQDIDSPALLFALMPKSAGTSISRGVAQCSGYQHGNAVATSDHDYFPNARISPEAFRTSMQYPVRLHTHIRATSSNLKFLNKSGIRKIVVHARDPRQAVVSYYYHCKNGLGMVRNRYANPLFDNLNDAGKFNWFIEFYYPKFINWIMEWVQVESNISKYSFTLKITTFEDMLRLGQINLVRDICDFCGITIKTPIVEQKHRVRKGIVDEWRSLIPKWHHRGLSEMMPMELKERFNWDA